MSTVVQTPNGFRVFVKGASEIILELAAFEEIDGVAVPLTKEKKVSFPLRIHFLSDALW
jgi:hypothetical protein